MYLRSLALVYCAALLPTMMVTVLLVNRVNLSLIELSIAGLAILVSLIGFPMAWIGWQRNEIGSWSQLGAWLQSLARGEHSPFPQVPGPVQPAVEAVSRSIQLKTEHISYLSLVDSQTGLLNRNGLTRRLNDEYARAIRFERSLAVVCIANYHQQQWDEQTAKAVGAQLRKYARSVDVIGRLDNDSFGFILPETSKEGAYQLCQRLIHDAKENSTAVLRAGITVYPQHSMSAERLLLCAEKAAESKVDSCTSPVTVYDG